MDAAIPADAQNAPTGIWKSRTEREIPTAPTPIIVVVNERKNNGDSNSVAKPSTESDQAQLADDGTERAGVFLTNALTGWEPRTTKPLPFLELEEERDRADQVKQETPILVILGNPPYNGFAGMAVDEERDLSDAYRTTRRVRRPEGQGLNDLYVRFFRMAERRIAEKTGRGVVCFISNYSWLDGLSFTGMRERYLDAFDAVRIDNLHGDRIISEYAPDGRTSETVFALRGQSSGIKVGTSIALLARSGIDADTSGRGRILYRDFHQARADERRQALLDSLDDAEIDIGYSSVEPHLRLGLPFKPMAVSEHWFDWPALPDLFPVSFPGVQTGRDGFLVDVDLTRLRARVMDYFDATVSHDEIARRYPGIVKTTARFDARAVREVLLARGGPDESGFLRHAYRPFDNRWLYWEAGGRLLDRPRPDYRPHVFEGNLWLSAAQHLRKGAEEPQTCFTYHLGARHLIERGANWFPAWLLDDGLDDGASGRRVNLSGTARGYLERLGTSVEDLFPPCARHPPRPRLSCGQCRRAPNGVAAHPASRLARWRSRWRGGGARYVSRTRPRTRPTARFRHARSRGHHRRAAA